jgi:hypothetical protein
MNHRLAVSCLLAWAALATSASAAPFPVVRPGVPVEGARTVVAAVVATAKDNAALPARGAPGARAPFRRSGDELTEYYVRAAAAAARKLPEKERAPAFLLGIGVALDTAALLRKNPVTGGLWEKVESDKERARRLAVLGMPTVHGRHDLAQHFSVSAALTAAMGAPAAEAAGIVKELLDAEGGSGFSFADLAADLAGVAFAKQVLAAPARLARLEKGFAVADYAPSPKGLVEGLQRAEFERRYGSVGDKRFRAELEALRKQVRALPGHKAGS